MNTWNAESPPQLGAISTGGRILGAVRVTALLSMTLVALVIFLLGRALRAVLGRWIVFHFLVARIWARLSLMILGIRHRVHGVPVTRGALVANHSTWIDIVALRAVRLVYFVSKSEVAKWPGVGYIARVTGTVFINRRRTEAKAQEAVLRERINHDQLLCFFPEGTSTDGTRVLPFKSSLFSAFFEDGRGTPIQIQPVTLHYRVGAHSNLPPQFFGWWGDMSFEGHIWDVACRRSGGQVDVVFHPPAMALDHPDRKALAEHCQQRVSAGFERIKAGGSVQDLLTGA